MILWVCGKFVKLVEEGTVWEIQGVYSTEEEAKKHCKDELYFIGPVQLNDPLPHERTDWPGCYYPLS